MFRTPFRSVGRRLLVGGALVALTALAAPAHADDEATEECIRTKVWDHYGDGWGARTFTSTRLESGATSNFVVTLYKGAEYKVLTCGDAAMKDLDVLLYDLEGNVVQRDQDVGREPTLTIKPTETATYYVLLYARALETGADDAGAALAVIFR